MVYVLRTLATKMLCYSHTAHAKIDDILSDAKGII